MPSDLKSNSPQFNSPQSNSPQSNSPQSIGSEVTLYLRNVPRHLSVQEIKDRLSKEDISVAGCRIEQTLSRFTGSKKFVKITLDSLDTCNHLDRALKTRPHLPWFLSVFPPRKQTQREVTNHNSNVVGSHIQAAHPLSQNFRTSLFAQDTQYNPPPN